MTKAHFLTRPPGTVTSSRLVYAAVKGRNDPQQEPPQLSQGRSRASSWFMLPRRHAVRSADVAYVYNSVSEYSQMRKLPMKLFCLCLRPPRTFAYPTPVHTCRPAWQIQVLTRLCCTTAARKACRSFLQRCSQHCSCSELRR